MEDFLGFIVLFVIFVLGPILEKARRGQNPPQQRRQPGTRRPAEMRPQPRSRAEPPIQRSETEDASATTVLPDELWEILTGQPRPKPQSQRSPVPEPEIEEFEPEVTRRDEWEFDPYPVPTAPPLPEVVVRHEPPVVVSMETQPIDPDVRHREFHKKLERTAPVARTAAPQVRPRLDRRKDLRDAILLQAILGPPKALE